MPFPVRDLPDFIPPYVPPTSSLSRASANRINSASTRVQEITMSLPGYDETIPLVYGEDRMAGLWLVRPYTHISSGELRFAIAWSWGGEQGIEGVQQIYFNGAVLPVGVTVTHYRGTPEQTIDPMLAADIPGFGDAYKYLAYTVFRVPPATIEGFPQQYQIEAVIRGIKVRDERIPDAPPVQARYWGIRINQTLATPAQTPKCYIAEIDMFSTPGGSSVIGSGTPGAGMTNMFDGNPATYWNSGVSDLPIIVYYDFGSDIQIQKMSIQALNASGATTRSPTAFDIVYSADGTTWATSSTFASDNWQISETRNFDFNEGGNILYSANPSLCMADFITRPESIGGLEKEAINIQACADRNDQLIYGERRCEIGLTIKNSDYANAMLDMFSAYAEVLWSYEEDGVLMVPDAPVEEPAYVFDYNDIKNLQLLGNEMTQSPTSVTVNIRIATGTEESWPQFPAVQYLPGVQDNEIEDVPSDLFMPGIHRISEGLRKALMRLRRLSYPSRFAFQTFDEGVQFQRGDVVQLPDELGLNTRLVRILSIEQIAPGRYQHTAEHYSPDMYPDDFIPGDVANWPEGTGLFFVGNGDIPAGWEIHEAADGHILFGASAEHPAGTITGDNTFVISGTTSLAGAHSGDGDAQWIRGSGSFGSAEDDYDTPEDDHDHDYSAPSPIERVPYNRRERVIIKTGGPGEAPANCYIMANGSLLSPVLQEVTQHLGRLIAAGAAASGGQPATFNVGLNYAAVPDHDHDGGRNVSGTFSPNFGPQSFEHAPAGAHSHNGSVSVTINVKRKRLAFFETSASSPAQVGAIAMYFGDPGDLDEGFNICDGTNGTIDLQDYFIERSSSSQAGQEAGDNTATWQGETNTEPPHEHKGELYGNFTSRSGFHQNLAGGHKHEVVGSVAYRPVGFSVYFIQYTGVI